MAEKMGNKNIVLIILDTLREDYSKTLDNLVGRGFVKYDNAIAQASWTLPSHISIFTGVLPSIHQVHESYGNYGTNMMNLARAKQNSFRNNILTSLKSRGYTSYCLTSNPFVSPFYGFEFDTYKEFDNRGEVSGLHDQLWSYDNNPIKIASSLLRAGKVSAVFKLTYLRFSSKLKALLHRPQLEKGSKYTIDFLKKVDLTTPFFLFVNLMEAHPPYIWQEDFDKALPAAIFGRPVALDYWRDVYPKHASLAAERAMQIVSMMESFDPLIIITSDHGQLLGENGRYEHGYFLDDVLLKVPLLVKYPTNTTAATQTGDFVSLTEIPSIILGVLYEKQVSIGSNLAYSESFGSQIDLSKYSTPQEFSNKVPEVYSARTKIYSKNGSVIYNISNRTIEKVDVGLSEEQVKAMINSIEDRSEERPSEIPPSAALSTEEEELIAERLGRLGYN